MTSKANPFTELERLFEQMQDNFERAARRWDPDAALTGGSAAGSTRVDLKDTGDELELSADLAGFDREEIDLRVTDHTLHLTAEREDEAQDEEGEYVRRERHRRSVTRSIQLPEAVRADDITATYTNGVLTVRMPKQEPGAEGTEIEIS